MKNAVNGEGTETLFRYCKATKEKVFYLWELRSLWFENMYRISLIRKSMPHEISRTWKSHNCSFKCYGPSKEQQREMVFRFNPSQIVLIERIKKNLIHVNNCDIPSVSWRLLQIRIYSFCEFFEVSEHNLEGSQSLSFLNGFLKPLYQIRRPLGLVFVIYFWWLGELLLLYI